MNVMYQSVHAAPRLKKLPVAKAFKNITTEPMCARIYKSKVVHSDGSAIDVEPNVSVVPYGRSLAALVFVYDIREK